MMNVEQLWKDYCAFENVIINFFKFFGPIGLPQNTTYRTYTNKISIIIIATFKTCKFSYETSIMHSKCLRSTFVFESRSHSDHCSNFK
jgi:hypothetical protein